MIRNVGELNRRITIQRQVKARDVTGMPLPEQWVDFKSRWANKADITGKEFFAAAAEQMLATSVFTIRHTEGIQNDMRILCSGQRYYIQHISELKGAGDYMEIRARREEPETGEVISNGG